MVEQEIREKIAGPHRSMPNLTDCEKSALEQLMNDKDLIIKPCDVGGDICVQDVEKHRN